MKKNIIIGVMAILTILSVAFGLVERTEANRQREYAIESEKRAQEQMQMAAISQREAELQYQRAMDCCNKK
jgi:hypothetical protein